MSRLGRRLLVVAALAGLVCYPSIADEQETFVRPVRIFASPEILPQGTVCEVELAAKKTGSRSSATTIYRGTILETTRDSLRLEVSEVQHEDRNEGLSTGLPFIDRHFKSSGVAILEPPADDKQIELATRTIESIRVITAPDADEHEPVDR